MMKNQPPKTIEEFAQELRDADLTVAEWARARSVEVTAVYALLQGTTNGTRGHARTAARAMGLALPDKAKRMAPIRKEGRPA